MMMTTTKHLLFWALAVTAPLSTLPAQFGGNPMEEIKEIADEWNRSDQKIRPGIGEDTDLKRERRSQLFSRTDEINHRKGRQRVPDDGDEAEQTVQAHPPASSRNADTAVEKVGKTFGPAHR